MNPLLRRLVVLRSLLVLGCAALALLPRAQATVLDNFDGATRVGWEDANPGGLPLAGGKQEGGQFVFQLPTLGQPFFVSSRKTTETFQLVEGRSLELRADMVSGQGPDSFAVLAFIPEATGPNTLAGYGIAKSESDILITKGINKYFYNENVNPPVKNNNITLVLHLKVKGGQVHITGQVLDKDDGNRVLWERSFVDTVAADVLADGEDKPSEPFINLPGQVVTYLYADGGQDPAGYQVIYDNLITYVCDEVVVDDFNGASRVGWEDANPGGLPLAGGTQADGVFTFNVPKLGQPFFVSSLKTTKTYTLAEGTRHEFAVDMISGRGPDSFVVMSWIPASTGPNTLAGYGLAKSETDILVIKGINKYFYNENVNPPVKNDNVRLTLTLTVADGKVEIRGRVLDKSDGDKVIFEKTFIDTPAADVLADGEDSPSAPFITQGNLVLYLYADGGQDDAGYQVVYDNLTACAPPAAGNAAPSITGVAPLAGANFLPATSEITFNVQDDQELPDAGITVVLNGTTYTTANGLRLSGTPVARTAALGGLVAGTDYSGEIRVVDAGGLEKTAPLFFDTFTTAVKVVEIEDYNFEAGSFFNSPVRTAEGGGAADNSYTDRVGTVDVDFSDTRTAPRPQDALYRTQDPVRMAHTLDKRRTGFDNDLSLYDYDVGDLAAGEWMNYTRTFTSGTYEIYLRESVVNLALGESILERVTSDPTQTGQTVELVGAFLGKTSGFDYRNVPLTDGAGLNRLKVRLDGRTTLRLRTVTADTSGGNRYLNYLLFVPVADAGTQRPSVAGLVPAPDSTVESVTPTVQVTLQNRDTTVNLSTVKLTVGGSEVTGATVTSTPTGATVTYALQPLPAPGTRVSASVSFKDSEGVEVKADWQFTVAYPYLDPATRISGTGKLRGFRMHVVQAPVDGGALENSLDRAESQLAAGSSIPRVVDTNAVVELVNFNKVPDTSAGSFEGDVTVPGIDPDLTGNGNNDFATEILTYLELPAGALRFGLITDDGYKLSSGTAPISSAVVPLAFHNGGSANEVVDFVVPQAGLYAFRLVWYERGGAGYAEWFVENPATGTRTLINDPTAAGAIKAWREIEVAVPQVVLESASQVQGPYAAEASAVINETSKTATVPVQAGPRFFRIRSGSALTLKGLQVQGANAVISWQ
ncbi:MAG: hypothetical protein IT580_07440 [Verrucomicrobiales bacterium]|nr:hypothetical protein [Verrucomicrobiales bacterium]